MLLTLDLEPETKWYENRTLQKLRIYYVNTWASQVALVMRNPPANAGDLGDMGFDPLEEDMATHSSSLAWRIPRTEEPQGHKESDMTEAT